MKILEYIGLDTFRVKASYRKVADAIARRDFRAAQVKKLANLGHGKFYRAKLDDADRLLFSLVRHGDEVCALMLEVIANHDYDKSRFTHWQRRGYGAFETAAILEAWKHLPANVVRPERNRRAHLSSVLSRNEVERDYAYNRALFMRAAQGWYQFNPKLLVRRRQGDEELWTPIYAALNLPLINEFSREDGWESVWDRIAAYLALAGMPERTIPIAAERALARKEALAREREKHETEARTALERRRERPAASRPARH
ncbi:MAG: hypothetical protein EPO19_04010 [Betaproteobacteria bacterium]|nr:MAG: hypothetical protein EPO19_04010 [Betaproteobacteria bacterium]